MSEQSYDYKDVSEIVILPGKLIGGSRGEYQRSCEVKATRISTYVDEVKGPVDLHYSHVTVLGSDDFPDGDYRLEYAHRRVLLSKIDGEYVEVGRCGSFEMDA